LARYALYSAAAALAVVAIIVLAFSLSQSSGKVTSSIYPTSGTDTSPGSTSTTNSFQAGNETYVATQASTYESATTPVATGASTLASTTASSSSTYTISSGYTTSMQTSGDSYSYAPSSQVKVLSVEATVIGGQPGDRLVTFIVNYENIGSSDIYVLEGAGSDLSATIISGPSLVSQVKTPMCEIAMEAVALPPGGNATAITPGCWSGFQYGLLQSGDVQVQLTFGWSNGAGTASGSIEIDAYFVLS